MKTAVISDIHSNFNALKKVLEEIQKTNCGRVICLGDIVGYGEYPNECVDLIKQRGVLSIKGNHEEALFKKDIFNTCSPPVKKTILWTKDVLTKDSYIYLKELPHFLKFNSSLFVHANNRDFVLTYILSKDKFLRYMNFLNLDEKIMFFGHTHIPCFFSNKDNKIVHIDKDEKTIKLSASHKYLINPGSVGQPRDGGISKASFIIYDDEKKEVIFKKIKTDD